MELRDLGDSGIKVSPLGLGTVKLGRNQQVKYPQSFALPDDRQVRELLALARDLGINLLDTAPAYGTSQERLGRLLGKSRQAWVIVSKVGEIFEDGVSRFDFGYAHTLATVENSLRTLRTDYLDSVLVHSDGDDLHILEHCGVVDALHELKRRGLIRTHGMSSKTPAGGLRAVEELDLVMVTCNLDYADDLPVMLAAQTRRKGVLIKKGLMSGHLSGPDAVRQSMAHVFSQAAVSSMIVGTIDAGHLRDNVRCLEDLLADSG